MKIAGFTEPALTKLSPKFVSILLKPLLQVSDERCVLANIVSFVWCWCAFQMASELSSQKQFRDFPMDVHVKLVVPLHRTLSLMKSSYCPHSLSHTHTLPHITIDDRLWIDVG
jgi:hypothetical protein